MDCAPRYNVDLDSKLGLPTRFEMDQFLSACEAKVRTLSSMHELFAFPTAVVHVVRARA